jgi:hypothetical protein
VLSSAALTAIGWVLVAAYLPLATDGVRHDVAALWDPAALIPGLVGLLLGMLAHARLLLGFIALETRCGLCAAASHLAGASSAGAGARPQADASARSRCARTLIYQISSRA